MRVSRVSPCAPPSSARNRRRFSFASFASFAVHFLLVVLSLSTAAFAQAPYPVRPIRIIVPTSPPGGADVVARVMAQPLSDRLGQQVVVENRAGASTMIGGEAAARAAPDGYTLVMGISTLAINPATFRKVPYDAIRDFAPITQAAQQALLLSVHPSVPVRLAGDGAEVVAGTPEEFGAFIRAETVKWAKVAKAAGIVPE